MANTRQCFLTNLIRLPRFGARTPQRLTRLEKLSYSYRAGHLVIRTQPILDFAAADHNGKKITDSLTNFP
jgi:hypothetical protein